MDTGFNYYHGADPGEYDLVISNSEGGARHAARARRPPGRGDLLGRRSRVLRAAARREGDRRLLLRLRRQVPARMDVGVRRRAVARAARRRLRARRPRLPRRHRPRAASRRHPVPVVPARDLGRADQPLPHAAPARDRLRVVLVPAVRARLGRRGDRREPLRRDRALVRAGLGAARRRPTQTRRSRPTARCSTTPAQAEEMGRRARERVLDEHTYRHRARRLLDLLDLNVKAHVD